MINLNNSNQNRVVSDITILPLSMAPFPGLQGNRLNVAALLGVIMPSIVSFGYNQS